MLGLVYRNDKEAQAVLGKYVCYYCLNVSIMDSMDFKHITVALLKKGFTEELLARECNTNQSAISRIKLGQVPTWPIGDALIKLYRRYKRRKDR